MIDKIKNVISKLPHSEGRVPYTYHHDYVRSHIVSSDLSRSDVAQMKVWSDEELWSTALVYIAENSSIYLVLELSQEDIEVLKCAKEITKNYIERFKTLPPKIYKNPNLCDECGKYPKDLPSNLCAGCSAYDEHQSI